MLIWESELEYAYKRYAYKKKECNTLCKNHQNCQRKISQKIPG